MKIFTDGARFFGGQIDRIDDAFVSLGHELVKDMESADLVYSNNPWFDKIYEAKKSGKISGKIILNILDMAPHLGPEFQIERLKNEIICADVVTCISETVKRDVVARLGVTPFVIYNPIKNIFKKNADSLPLIKLLFVGRVNDPEKRSGVAVLAANGVGFKSNEVLTVGGDRPYYGGAYGGPVDDETLNNLYNRAQFLGCPTRNAFLGLPILEASSVGCIPLFLSDLDIREEFFPTELFPEYAEIHNYLDMANFIKKMENTKNGNAFRTRLIRHFADFLAPKVKPLPVAEKILKIYNSL